MSTPLPAPGRPAATSASGSRHTTLGVATIVDVGFAVCLAQVGVAVPATLNGTFQTALHPTGASQLDWISDAILLPIAALDLTFGVSITDTGLPSLILPMGLVGVGFAFAVSSVTSTVVNTVPPKLAGMAAATTSMVRDFGFALGPALIGAIALSKAAGLFNTAVNADPSLSALRAAVEGAGPVAVNSVPPSVAISEAALHAVTALSSGYSTGFLVVAIAALACAVATALFLGGRAEQEKEIAIIEHGEDAAVA